jgi:hypothetical protein
VNLREELEKEMNEAAQRIPLVLQQSVYGPGPSTDDPIEQVHNVAKAQLALIRIHQAAILRLADEIDRLSG